MRTLHLFSLTPNKDSFIHTSTKSIKLPNNYYLLPKKPYIISQNNLGEYLPEVDSIIRTSYEKGDDPFIKETFAHALLNQALAYEQITTILKEKARKIRND